MSRPLPIAFLILISGIFFASRISIPLTAVLLSTVFLLVLVSILKKRFNGLFYISICVLIFVLGVIVYLNFNAVPPGHISHFAKDRDCFAPSGLAMTYAAGTIVSPPEYKWGRWNRRKASFTIKASALKREGAWIKVEGLSVVKIRDNKRDYSYGDKILILGEIKRPPGAKVAGGFDYAQYLMKKRIYTIIDVTSDDEVVLEAADESFFLKKVIFRAREEVQQLIKKNLPVQDAAILSAMLIGERSGIREDLRQKFINTGTAHVLSVSGLHVGLLASVFFLILRSVRIPRKASGILLMGFLSIYVIFTGGRTPVIRASIMIGVYLFSYISERRFDIYSALSLAGILILLLNPMDLFNAGFVLSFACVFSICCLTPKLKGLLLKLLGPRVDRKFIDKNRSVHYVLEITMASAAVYIGIAPLTAYYFNIISPITILANIFVVPLLWVVLFLGVLFTAGAVIFTPMAVLLSYPLHLTLFLFAEATNLFSSLRFGHFYVFDIPIYIAAFYYVFLLLISNLGQIDKLRRIL